MIRPAVLVGILCAVAGCAGGQTQVAVEPDCVGALIWKGVAYGATDASGSPELGGRVGSATIPACGSSIPERRVEVVAIRGVPPSVALVSPGFDRDLVWLGPGYLPSSPKHPLHDAIEHSVGGWDAEQSFRCEGTRVLRVEARWTPGALDGYLEVSAADEAGERFLADGDVRGIVSLDEESAFVGFERHGIPFIRARDAFELTVSECEGRDSEPLFAGLRKLIVREIRPASPGR